MSGQGAFEDLRANYKDVLSHSFINGDIDSLDTQTKSESDTERKSALDQAFRDKLLEILSEDLDVLEKYIFFCIESCRRQMVTPTMPVVLLGDMFDSLTLNKCEKMFTYVENNVSIWKEELFFGACKNNLLRMCNDLLRRLSRSQNTVFCGRILLFLAKFFPFSERSGLNIVSEFNLDNVTEFGADSSAQDAFDEETVKDTDKNKLNIDYNLYCKFWSLQDFFRNPNTCYNRLQWKTFVAHSTNVLSAFSSYKLETVELQKSKLNRLKTMSTDIEMSNPKESHYFAKFLTNQKLLELQLSDSNFRRCVLIQFLILFQYLTSSVKFKMDTQELKSDQADWVKDATTLVYKLLSDTPPDGKKFAECVKHILKREEHWNNWKNDGCPEFQKPKPPVQSDSTEDTKRSRKRRRPVGDIIKEYEAQGKAYLGNNELTKLWNLCPDNLAACRTKERDFMPALDTFIKSAVSTDGRRRTSEGGWGWRALRLLARRSPHFFTHSNNPIASLPDYLDEMVKRVVLESSLAAANSQTNGTNGDIDKGNTKQDTEEEMNEDQNELITEGDTNEIEQVPDSTQEEEEEKNARSRVTMINQSQLDIVSNVLTDWKKLAAKLGFKADEIEFFESENPSEPSRAMQMLKLWFDDDEDASVENLLYIMEGLEMNQACEALKGTV